MSRRIKTSQHVGVWPAGHNPRPVPVALSYRRLTDTSFTLARSPNAWSELMPRSLRVICQPRFVSKPGFVLQRNYDHRRRARKTHTSTSYPFHCCRNVNMR